MPSMGLPVSAGAQAPKTASAFAANGAAPCGFRSVLSRRAPGPAADSRLSPNTPAPACSSRIRGGGAIGGLGPRATFMSRRIASKTSRLAWRKTMGLNRNGRPSMSSVTSEGPWRSSQRPSSPLPSGDSLAKMPPSPAPLERKCAQMECHWRCPGLAESPLAPLQPQSRLASGIKSGTSARVSASQIKTSCTKPLIRSTVSCTWRREPGSEALPAPCGYGSTPSASNTA
mmetsp:Transcript_86925/g.259320  ORF Transcript_86925/g.259320 Transcript_86925/m.259320 type:complete len:229 (-) Transcript_86925:98-784(-)